MPATPNPDTSTAVSVVPAEGLLLELRDGSRVLVRPISTEDRWRIEQGLQQLSARSRYLRFHSAVEKLSESQLDYLTDVDHHDHEALVALDPDRPDSPGAAVARYIRMPDQPSIAEAAITVVDEYQGRGIGTALIGLLEALAHERGIRIFRNYVLAENQAMLEIFRQLDGTISIEGSGLYRVDVPVPGAADPQPDTPAGRWVSLVGRHTNLDAGDTSPASWAYPLLWVLRKVTGVELGAVDQKVQSRLLKRWAGQDDAGDQAG
ncbi:MAG: GNAT family N-acetyltransferase [Euzebya sp.]